MCLTDDERFEKQFKIKNDLTIVPDFEQKWVVPDSTGWDKYQVYQYLKDRGMPEEITDMIIKNVRQSCLAEHQK